MNSVMIRRCYLLLWLVAICSVLCLIYVKSSPITDATMSYIVHLACVVSTLVGAFACLQWLKGRRQWQLVLLAVVMTIDIAAYGLFKTNTLLYCIAIVFVSSLLCYPRKTKD